MQKGRAFNWRQIVMAVCMSMLLVPVWAQVVQETKIKPEVLLNGISLDSTFREVLTRRGVPHYIGPSISGVDSVTRLLSPAQQKGAAGPAVPVNPNMPGGRQIPPQYGMNAGPAQIQVEPKKENIYMVWRYDGNGKTPDPKASYTTYVFINDEGIVEAVVVNLNNPESSPNIETETGITFGTRLSDIVKIYNWPEPFTRAGSLYYCSYPEQRVTFALDANTRKVTCISIGVPFVVTAQSLEPGQAAQAGAASGRPAVMVPRVSTGGAFQSGMQPLDTPTGRYPYGMNPDGDVPASRMGGDGNYPGQQAPPPPPPG